MPKTELDGKPMLRIFKAIITLRAGKHMATSHRIAPLVKRLSSLTSHILVYLWEWGYLKRKPIKTPGNKQKQAGGCTFHYLISKKGERKYKALLGTFGDITLQPPTLLPTTHPPQAAHNHNPQRQCCVT